MPSWERFTNGDPTNEASIGNQNLTPSASDWQGLASNHGEYWKNANQNLIANNVLPDTQIFAGGAPMEPASGSAQPPWAIGAASESGWTPNDSSSGGTHGEGDWQNGGGTHGQGDWQNGGGTHGEGAWQNGGGTHGEGAWQNGGGTHGQGDWQNGGGTHGEGAWQNGGGTHGHHHCHREGGDSNSSTSASGNGDQLVNQLLADPALLQSLQSLQGQMSAQGFAQVENSIGQQLATNSPSSDSTLLAQALQQGQAGLSPSDLAALETAISNLPATSDSGGTTPTAPTSTDTPTTPTSTDTPTPPKTPTSTDIPTAPTSTDTLTPPTTTTGTVTDGSGSLPPPVGYSSSQLILNDQFSNLNNWNMGVNDVQGQGSNVTWPAAAGVGTDTSSAVSTGSDGLTITANASAGTSGSITSKDTFGGNGQPYYVQFQMSGGQDWPAVWMLPAAGGLGLKEIDIQEGNMGGADNMTSHYHAESGGATEVTGTGNNLDNTMNTYGAYVQNGSVTLYLNGAETGVLNTDQDNLSTPMRLIVSNEVQGSADSSYMDPAAAGATQMNISNLQVYSGPPSS